jgi:RNA polymerase sigma-70 factor (ECF subfamily)
MRRRAKGYRVATPTPVRYNAEVTRARGAHYGGDGRGGLLAELRRRDPRAFEVFFERYADRVYRLALHLLGQAPDAEEVVQATFLSAFEAIDRFEARASLGTWLYTIAYRHVLMLLRRRRPADPLPDERDPLPLPNALVDWTAWPESRALDAEARAILQAAIEDLAEPYRAAVVLRDVEALSTADCAQVQGISEAACKVRLHRARLLLRERLSGYFGERAHRREDA